MMSTDVPALALTDIVKRFGRVVALDGATLIARQGSVHALLGENGAGKTTLMRIAFGMTRADAGQVTVRGRSVVWRSPADAIAAGVGMVHQHFTLVPAMTAAENVELGAVTRGRWRFDRRAAEDRVRRLGHESGLAVDPAVRVADLPVAAQQRVEILKTLGHDATVLILDEPTAVLAPREVEELLRWLRTYSSQNGTVILITHKLREALAVADEVTVLRRGRTVLTASRTDVDERTLTRAMIGEEIETTQRSAVQAAWPLASTGEPVAVLDAVTAGGSTDRESIRASFAIHAGQIVGVVGVEGSGQHVLLRLLAGRITPTGGHLMRPPDVAFVPEDRHREGLILDFTLAENIALRGAGARRGLMPWSAIRRRTSELATSFRVRAPSVAVLARTLSGGNQQRLVLARELDGDPPLIVAENPTRGLDVRATSDVHERLETARAAGTAVVLYSSDLDEVLALATRVIVVHGGLAREVAPERDVVGQAMLGLR